jgi:hypothetical protein
MPEDTPQGSLKAFGMPFAEGVHESDRDSQEESVDLATIEAGPEEEPKPSESREEKFNKLVEIEKSAAPVEEAPEEEAEEAEVDQYEALLNRAAGISAPEATEEQPESRMTTSEMQLREAYARQQGRLEALEDRIKDRQQPVEPAAEEQDEGPDYSDPRVQALLAEALSDPARVGPTLKVLVETEAERLVNKQVGPLAEQLGKYQAQVEDQTQRSAASTNITAGLRQAYDMGGIEAAVIRQAEQYGPRSMLYRYLQNNPVMATSSEGIVAATMLVARAVQLQEGQQEQLPSEQPAPVAPSLTSGKRPTVATNRGQKLNKPKEEKSEEEVMRDMIRNSRRQSAKLDFMR